ncbi:MAG: glycosyltransferase family 2 protein [Lachnospiraceae bacterium]|nr:glycosyltransferase family 2 protein [Lachnospiraceae bacterium]
MRKCERWPEENGIKFSVLIPTRDRLDLLKTAVASVQNQTYENWELVIVDNCSEEDVGGYAASLADSRIVFYRQSEAVSVTKNWNTANGLASGDYRIMLGDDDALLPKALEILAERISRHGHPEIVSFMAYEYLQPHVDPQNREGNVALSVPFLLDDNTEEMYLSMDWRRRSIEACFSFEKVLGYNMQFYCYSRKLVQRLERYGAFYEPPYPDYYTTSMAMLLAETFLYIPEVITVIGVTPKSYGCYYRNNNEKEGMKFHKEENFRSFAPLSVREMLCSVDEMDTAAFATFALAAKRLKGPYPSLKGYYKAVLKREALYRTVEELRFLTDQEMAAHITEAEKRELYAYAQELKNTRKGAPAANPEKPICFASLNGLLKNVEGVEKALLERSDRQYGDIDEWLKAEGLEIITANYAGRSIRVWGAYPRGIYLKQKLRKAGFLVNGCIDRMALEKNFAEKTFAENTVLSPKQALSRNREEYIVIPLLSRHAEILEWLKQGEYEPEKDFLYMGVSGGKPEGEMNGKALHFTSIPTGERD